MRLIFAFVPLLVLFSASSFAANCPDVKELADALGIVADAVHESGEVSDADKAKLLELAQAIGIIADEYKDDGLRQGVNKMTKANSKEDYVGGLDHVVRELDEAYAEHCGG